MSCTRSRSHSTRRSPEPYSKFPAIQYFPSSWESTRRTSSGESTTGSRRGFFARSSESSCGNLQLQNRPVEEQQRVKGLVLGRRRDLSIYRQVSQKRLDFGFAQLTRVTPVVESHKPPNPVNVGFLGPVTIVLEMDTLPDDLQQHRLIRPGYVSTSLPVISAPLFLGIAMRNQ